ncbi:MAG TPA: hypothetical protein VGO22_08445 [Pseudorhizobium sp.]|jgi:hypothetical protein|nr:hypothetical protein [Pseudorhizobium sp.]
MPDTVYMELRLASLVVVIRENGTVRSAWFNNYHDAEACRAEHRQRMGLPD